jgi:hypothetical protein
VGLQARWRRALDRGETSVDREPMAESRTSLDTLDTCVEDATRYGYSGEILLPDAG